MEENNKFQQEDCRGNERQYFHRGKMNDEKRWEMYFSSWGKDCPEEMKNEFKEMHKAFESKMEEMMNMRKEFSQKWKDVLGEKFPEREHMMNAFGRHCHGNYHRGDHQHSDHHHGGMHGRLGFMRHGFGSDH